MILPCQMFFLWKVLDFVEGNILVWRADIDLAKSFFGAWPWGPLLNRGVQHPPQLQGGSWMVRVTETWGLFFRRKSPMSNEMLPDGRMNFHHITAYSNRPFNWLGRIPKKCSCGTEIGPLHLWSQPGLSNPTTETKVAALVSFVGWLHADGYDQDALVDDDGPKQFHGRSRSWAPKSGSSNWWVKLCWVKCYENVWVWVDQSRWFVNWLWRHISIFFRPWQVTGVVQDFLS